MQPSRISVVLTVLTLASAARGHGQTADRFTTQLEPLVEQAMREQEIPGLALAVVAQGKIVYAKGFGVTALGEAGRPVTPATLFHVASISKTFVATAIMQLAEQNLVDLDAPVVRYLPYFKLADSRGDSITVRQMLTHRSGMPDVEDYQWGDPRDDDGALERYVRGLGDKRLLFPPGSDFRYSNMAYEVLGDVVAKVSGETFEGYVTGHILQPLGMVGSTLMYRDADPAILARGHALDGALAPRVSLPYPYNRAHTPSSNVHAGAGDLARWAMAHMNRGELDGHRILRPGSYDIMWQRAAAASPVGISWFLGDFRGRATVSHGGSDRGFRTNLVMIPDLEVAAIALVNADWVSPTAFTTAALQVALGLEPAPIDVRRSLVRTLGPTILRGDMDAAIALYHELEASRPRTYNFDRDQLDLVATELQRRDRDADALRILALNAEAYPKAPETHIALAKAWLRAHDTEAARKALETALALAPDNQEARTLMEGLKAE